MIHVDRIDVLHMHMNRGGRRCLRCRLWLLCYNWSGNRHGLRDAFDDHWNTFRRFDQFIFCDGDSYLLAALFTGSSFTGMFISDTD